MSNENANRCVLIVEDSDTLRALLKKVISQKGYTVLDARGGTEALKMMTSVKIDFIISDLDMPTGDGITLFAFLKQKNVKIPTLVLTGYSDATVESYAAYGVQAVVHKPIDPTVMTQIFNFLK